MVEDMDVTSKEKMRIWNLKENVFDSVVLCPVVFRLEGDSRLVVPFILSGEEQVVHEDENDDETLVSFIPPSSKILYP